MTAALRHYAPRGGKTTASYLGYPLEITNSDITIRDKRTGMKLATVASMPAARRFLRGYRRETVKAEPAASPVKATAGSDKENVHA